MTRVAALIFHAGAAAGSGPLVAAFAATRRANADVLAAGFRRAGAGEAVVVDSPPDERSFGQRLRDAVAQLPAGEDLDGVVVLGSGSIPLARRADLAAFMTTAAGPSGQALTNNRFSSDVVAIAGMSFLAHVPDLASDNSLPRWLADGAGYDVRDVARRWRLQVDLDSPLDAVLAGRSDAIDAAAAATATVRRALARVAAVGRDPRAELIVAGRASAGGIAWLERSTASRTRALVEERGFRTRPPGQRPAASVLGLLLDADGPQALGTILARLGDGALVDSRVLLAHRLGTDESRWPVAEDRFASDLLLADDVVDPWLRLLTRAARDAAIPIVLGGHSLVGPGLRLALGRERSWT